MSTFTVFIVKKAKKCTKQINGDFENIFQSLLKPPCVRIMCVSCTKIKLLHVSEKKANNVYFLEMVAGTFTPLEVYESC